MVECLAPDRKVVSSILTGDDQNQSFQKDDHQNATRLLWYQSILCCNSVYEAPNGP